MLQNTSRGVQIKGNRQGNHAPSDSSLLVDSYRNEVAVLSRQLGSKTEALAIMARELDQCRLDRDQFRAMLEQLRDARHSKGGSSGGSSSWSQVASDAGLRHQLALSRQQCAELQQTVSDLTVKMEEVCGDMMVLRRDAVRLRRPSSVDSEPPPDQTDVVRRLEQLHSQNEQLRRDLELVLDEKEELVTQRDAYKGKTHRLNHQLAVALRAPSDSGLDIDSLVTENRYLRDQLSSSQDEIERLTRVCAKYKALLETKKKKGILRLGTAESSALVVTKRQVEEMLRGSGDSQLTDTPATLSDLRSLCAALLEQLQDKCTALQHQRRANRLLADRCSQLQSQASRHGLPVQPSVDLMQGYSVANIDRESEQIGETPETNAADAGAETEQTSPQSPAASENTGPTSPQLPGNTGPTSPQLTGNTGPTSPQLPGNSWPTSPQLPGNSGPTLPQLPGNTGPTSPQLPGNSGPTSPQHPVAPEDIGPTSPELPGNTGPASPELGVAPENTGPASPELEAAAVGPAGGDEEEILSIQQLDRYVRCLRQGADVRPARVLTERPAPAETRTAELPPELDRLYRRALDELRSGSTAGHLTTGPRDQETA